jgi:alkylated DNA repair dioxygenase AlkB
MYSLELDLHDCGKGCFVWIGRIPESLHMHGSSFEDLWNLHPNERPIITMHGRKVRIPRWQQAYGMDYQFSGEVNRALAVPLLLLPIFTWSKQTIDARLNGLLLNWYDGSLGHYIGRHRDSTVNMVKGAPIVTISFGESRTFRLRQWRSATKTAPIDLSVEDGAVLILPFETNLAFTHEIPASKQSVGKRISVTLRAFESSSD